MKTHEEIQADLPLYALGSLDPDEHRSVAEHLAAGCDECARELESWNEVVAAMPLIAPEAPAPDLTPRLREIIGARPAPEKRPVARLTPRRWWVAPLAAAAVIALVIGGSRALQWRDERDQRIALISELSASLSSAQRDLERTAALLAEREKDVGSLRAALARADESLKLLQSPGLQLVDLAQPSEAPPAEAHMLLDAKSGRALFYAFDLPPAPTGKTYELWWITKDGGPVQAGLFAPDERGLGRLEADLPQQGGAIQAAAVTIEPAGGTAKPTGPMVLVGKLTAS